MKSAVANLYIGTSGWSYAHWTHVLYPEGLLPRERLGVYARHFATVELNASYYRWPRASAFAHWRRRLPNGFVMSVKAPGLLTHVRRLYGPERWVARRAARAGIVAVVAAGLLQLNTIVQTIPFVGGPCGPTNGDCVGTPPWARVGIAVLVGVTWFVVSLGLSGIVRSVREHRRR